jgi:signal transduction histidine kinase
VAARSHAPRVDRLARSPAAVLEERARIARDLHDTITQTMYAITLDAARALQLIDQHDAGQLHRTVVDIAQLAEAGQVELRALVGKLRSARPSRQTLTETLRTLAAEMQARSGLEIRVEVTAEPAVAPAVREACALVAQEALRNAARHAHAAHVVLSFHVEAAEVVLSIRDDGRGFDPARSRPGHFGLPSMRERAAAVGGTLEVVSGDGPGSVIRLHVPR